jgi:hypothetical protein
MDRNAALSHLMSPVVGTKPVVLAQLFAKLPFTQDAGKNKKEH